MDFSLAGDGPGRSNNQERSAYTARDREGNTVLPQHMDVSLLMLYGHILYAGKSYAYANSDSTGFQIYLDHRKLTFVLSRLFPSSIVRGSSEPRY